MAVLVPSADSRASLSTAGGWLLGAHLTRPDLTAAGRPSQSCWRCVSILTVGRTFRWLWPIVIRLGYIKVASPLLLMSPDQDSGTHVSLGMTLAKQCRPDDGQA